MNICLFVCLFVSIVVNFVLSVLLYRNKRQEPIKPLEPSIEKELISAIGMIVQTYQDNNLNNVRVRLDGNELDGNVEPIELHFENDYD